MHSLTITPEQRIQEIEKELIKVSIIDAPGTIMVGLGLYGKYGANDNAFHPLLNDPNIFHTLIAVGAAIMAWGGYKILTLSREKVRLKSKHGI